MSVPADRQFTKNTVTPQTQPHTASQIQPRSARPAMPMLAVAILLLLGAIWAGLLRLGWAWPVIQPALPGAHGPLMVSGFFGALISLERAVALRRPWTFAAPILAGLGGLLLLAGVPGPGPALLLFAGSLGLVIIFLAILRQHLAPYTLIMASGSLAWLIGNFLWMTGWPVHRMILWWATFLILTIAGERLELGRMVRHPPRVGRLFLLSFGVFAAGLALSLVFPDYGVRLTSSGMLALAAWLLSFDIARRTIRQTGLPRFAAVCLLSGYVWLGLAGILGLAFGAVPAGFRYDAFLHSVFLGFVFAMIFGHAPIIFPAILGRPIRFSNAAYLPLFLLHASLLLRIAGDLLLIPGLRSWGGLLNGVTILVFLMLTARSVLAEQVKAAKEETPAVRDEEVHLLLARERLLARRVFLAALAAFLLAGLTGSLLRLWLWQGFPLWANFVNVRHAHSHLMYFSWVTPALMALVAARLPAFTRRRNPSGLWVSAFAAFALGLLSFPPFFLWGYRSVEVGGARLPLAAIISSLNMLAWYAYMFFFWRAIRGVRRNRPLKLWNAALVFLIAASLGAWGRAALTAMQNENAFLAAASVHLFLDLFSGGWAVLGVLGLIYAAQPRLAQSISGWEDPLLFLGLPLSFLLGIPIDLVPADLRTLAGLGGLLAAGGLVLHARALWAHINTSFWNGWRLPLAFMLLTAGMQAAASLPGIANWAEHAGLRILYLHTSLLGFISLGLLNSFFDLLTDTRKFALVSLGWAVTGLLLSLLPISGLWPGALAGIWRLAVAFLLSLGPWGIAAGILWRQVRSSGAR